MKNKALLFLAVAVVAVVAGGASAVGVSRYLAGESLSNHYVLSSGGTSEIVSHDAMPQAGNHFAAYAPNEYPDLTYAAENAVQAVVNIEAVREVQVGGSRSYGFDPFYEFFGIPYGGGRSYGEPQTREQRAGGSGTKRFTT